jgi:hypothetical protein
VNLRCPCCDVELTVVAAVLAVAPAPTRSERIAQLNELDPEACGRRWALEEEQRTLARLEAERDGR